MTENKSIPLAEFRHVHVHRDEDRNSDSIEIGTPGKGGVLKVYLNTDDPEAAVRRIDAGFALRQYAQDLQDGNRQIKKIEVLAPGITVRLENKEGKKEVIEA
ncbi:hypothetical protein DSECCO2_213010 [anaerobic digester metagenome]